MVVSSGNKGAEQVQSQRDPPVGVTRQTLEEQTPVTQGYLSDLSPGVAGPGEADTRDSGLPL